MRDQKDKLLVAVIGDVHDRWELEDNLALQHLGVDLALFVGDFGNESVEIIKLIAKLPIPKAVILGNHDAWYTASGWGRKKSPYDHSKEDRVQQQLDILGSAHVGYGKLDFPDYNLSVVGGRPFSWGGSQWKNHQFYRDRYQINNFAESTTQIVAAAQETLYEHLIFIGHNGPFGLGDQPEDSCGKDWNPLGGDHGDPDFTEAIDKTLSLGKTISLVTFGHMHHRLRHRQDRLRTIVNRNSEGVVYLNAAAVPRIKIENSHKLRNFSLVTLGKTLVSQISLVWVDEQYAIASEEILYKSCSET
ncbi:Calcineurin-like phosphoesterase [Xenococcus sp. PCC 7305]|uniref:TIGR04168 family protein n=1 Tax=Xenococcus sp. PCC 7305 TaxID=102125 RepID=UPI0002ACB03D|nr:TIGR04168 family protein [Xenococcus sp. PCC 7305]ELS03066.1 Calcineurin-like phosphoesterase [Xenococcus sp. PCC 7305]